jgi:predicted N-acetyltransferase YhbS
MITLRHETEADHTAITRVNDLAFGRKAEGKLIRQLRAKDSFIPELSIVAEYNSQMVGHILFTPVDIISDHASHRALTLAPMAVIPEFQKKSIGKLMIIFGLQEARELGYRVVVVLGHPSYYPKFGFRKASQWNITSPFPAPDEAFMAAELIPESLHSVSGRVIFPAEFEGL